MAEELSNAGGETQESGGGAAPPPDPAATSPSSASESTSGGESAAAKSPSDVYKPAGEHRKAQKPPRNTREARRAGLAELLAKKESEAAKQATTEKTPIEKQRDAEAGKEAAGAKQTPAEGEAEPDKPPASAAAPEKKPEAVKPKLKAPQSWSKEQAQHWDAMPEAAQQVVLKRERDMMQWVQRTEQQWKPFQKFATDFASVVGPYKAMMEIDAQRNGRQYNPLFTMKSLLHTAAQLQHTDKRVGAGVIAQVIQSYGITPDLIADALQGKGVTPQQSTQMMEEQRRSQQPAFDPQAFEANIRKSVLSDLNAQRDRELQTVADSEMAEFSASHEHYEDVKETMADLIESHARRGVELSIESAYRLACLADSTLGPAVLQAEAAQAALAEKAKQQASTPRAQQATATQQASSIRSRPGGATRAPEKAPKSRREMIAEAVHAKLGGRG